MHLSWLEPPDPCILVLTALGLLIAPVVWFPHALRRLSLSLLIVCVLLGARLFSLPGVTLQPLSARFLEIAEGVTKFVAVPFARRAVAATLAIATPGDPLEIDAQTAQRKDAARGVFRR